MYKYTIIFLSASFAKGGKPNFVFRKSKAKFACARSVEETKFPRISTFSEAVGEKVDSQKRSGRRKRGGAVSRDKGFLSFLCYFYDS